MTSSLLVILGSALGGLARYWLQIGVAALTGPRLPWGTLLINVTGSFVIGAFAVLTAPDGRTPLGADLRIFVMVGICGGFTTFSSFSLQSVDLIRAGLSGWAVAYGAGSVVLCVAAAWAGVLLGR